MDGLIRAYALLPVDVRRAHQLAIVCAAEPADAQRLKDVARRAGLGAQDVVITGYVSDDDLVALYTLCALFVFPSLSEGFGLPLLEAMSCGAPVIGADNSSLPEIIGERDALFDGRDDAAVAAAIHRGLTDNAFRQHLRQNAPKRARKFSWDISARRTIAAFEELHGRRQRKTQVCLAPRRPKLAYIAPLPPERSGIADYSVELLSGLTRHYQIDVIVNQTDVSAPAVVANCGVRSADWFDANAHRYDRVLYEFGNSHFHQHMFGLIKRHPGVVSLHDFFLGGAFLHMERASVEPHCWSRAIYGSHGYPALAQRFADPTAALLRYPANRPVLENAIGVLSSSSFSRDLAREWYGLADASRWTVVPQVRCPEPEPDPQKARAQLGVAQNDFVVCSFGIIAPTKLNHRLLAAWRSSALGDNPRCRLVFVGDDYGSDYGEELRRSMAHCPLPENVQITGFQAAGDYRLWLAAADVAVQLRTQSRGETSRGTLDCLAHGLPTLVNGHGSMPELPVSRMLPDAFSDHELAAALCELRADPAQRRALGKAARHAVVEHHNPRTVADLLCAAVEGFYERAQCGRWGLLTALARLPDMPAREEEWLELSEVIAQVVSSLPPARQVLLDVSDCLEETQDAARTHVLDWLRAQLDGAAVGARIEPVFRDDCSRLHYARRFTLDCLGLPQDVLSDEPAHVRQADIYLDLFPRSVRGERHDALLTNLRNLGVRVFAFLGMPSSRRSDLAMMDCLSSYDGAVCTNGKRARALLEQVQRTLNPRGLEFAVGCVDVDDGHERGRQLLQLLCDRNHSGWMQRQDRNPRRPGRVNISAQSRGLPLAALS